MPTSTRPDAWGIIDQSPNVLVAVIDTGIDFNHPDLQANIWTNPNPGQYGYANDLHGWNFYANNNTPAGRQFSRHSRLGNDRGRGQ